MFVRSFLPIAHLYSDLIMNCYSCGSQCISKRRPKDAEVFGTLCDCCSKAICKKCAKLTSTEVDGLILQQRQITFHCFECKKEILNMNNDFKCLNKAYEKATLDLTAKDKQIEELLCGGEILREQINDLQAKLTDKENYIKRLKRGSQCLEELAIEREQELEAKLQCQTKTIQILNGELNKLKKEHLTLIDSEQVMNNAEKSLKEKLLAAEELIENFTISSITLKSEIEALSNELKAIRIINLDLQEEILSKNTMIEALQNDVTTLNNRIEEISNPSVDNLHSELLASTVNQEHDTSLSTNQSLKQLNLNHTASFSIDTNPTSITSQQSVVNDGISIKKSRITVFTDSFGKFLHSHLDKVLKDFNIRTICKPNASCAQIIKDMDCYIGDMSAMDYVIFLAGISTKEFKKNEITLLTNKCFHTNLIICTIPTSRRSPTADVIDNINNTISRNVSILKSFSVNIDLLELHSLFTSGHFKKNSTFLNRSGLRRLARDISGRINCFGDVRYDCNLRFLTPSCSISNLPPNSETPAEQVSVNFLGPPPEIRVEFHS